MADTENRGFLTPEDFAKALRLVAHHQSRPERPLTEALFLERKSSLSAPCIRALGLLIPHIHSFPARLPQVRRLECRPLRQAWRRPRHPASQHPGAE
jgi:hypothetical protein